MKQDTKFNFSATNTYYQEFRDRNTRFDGRVFVGVSSTRIYCRPMCRARTPREQNCTFFPSAAAAETAGYRPCLKCRPELAPGLPPVNGPSHLARKAALLIEENGLCSDDWGKLALSLGVAGEHLRRLFVSEFSVSPEQYRQTQRMLLAKNLLTDTHLPLAAIAQVTGFDNARHLEASFQKYYRLPPARWRRKTKPATPGEADTITLYAGYRPPYLWDTLLDFLAGRNIPGVESIIGGAYHRTVALSHGGKTYRGWISVRHAEKKQALAVTLPVTLLSVLPQVWTRVKRLFDLHCEPGEIYGKLAVMNEFMAGICRPGTRLPGCFDPFEMAVRAVLGQQITVKAARTLAGRVAGTYGQALSTPIDGLTHTFPTPAHIAGLEGPIEDHLGPLGVTGARARSIRSLAEKLLSGEIDLSGRTDPQKEMKKLLALPGFGPWTVNYVAMRALSWPDAFPHTDYGVKKVLAGRTAKEILALSEPWKPYRAYATINIWNSL
ncbi:MAG: helix-turn-helix domain-containing protein [Peptococcaceae bacterium]|nr:helix-turn-helix domain-containing protein [Candidatus Syntrophopropionicum ammoniitolerans]